MKSHLFIAAALITASWMAAAPVRAQEVTSETVNGITHFRRLETTVACTGAIKADVVPKIKEMGFASIINLRQPSEPGADIEAEAVAAKAVGVRYYSIP